MRSRLSTTALLTTSFLAAGAAFLPQAASAGDYFGPRASAAEINHVINSSSSYGGGYGGGYGGYSPRYGGGYGGGYVSRDYGHDGYGYGHAGYGHDGRGYGYADHGYGDRYYGDLDDFHAPRRHRGVVVYRYRTYAPFEPATDYAEPTVETQDVRVETHDMQGEAHDMHAATDKPEPRSDVGRPILFAAGMSGLSETAAADLDRIGNILLAYTETDVRVLLTAYTDATGTQEQNEAISMKRVAAVKAYLSEKFDIPADRFVEAPFGETPAPGIDDPLAPENRQVVVALLGLDLDKTGDRPVADAGEPVAAETASYRTAEPTCRVPAYPHADYSVEGRLVAAGFQDIDDFGGGRVIEVCKIGH
ncbi:OmpA family protein [Jiella sonneratiae]|uniref:OmpA family protein n=1 Tax=Jiella sonneratiae TaxID=2816856 RepID=A0ABS3J759_9HYPH|nr:OmpA family protein [Jiella sonneratiae]MBO0905472.1 OmpA family protein [Jiella sonneratiae]